MSCNRQHERTEPEALRSRVTRLREHQWTPIQRPTLIGVLSIVIASLFVATYQLALGDPVPHRINAALIGDRSANARTVGAVERVAGGKLALRSYESVAAALHAIDEQRVYAALDLTSSRPTLYVASAAGTSVAHALEWIYAIDPLVRVVDTRPVASDDPNGLDIFYLMLVATIIGFFTVFTVRGMAGNLELRHHVPFVLILAGAGALVLTSVDGPPGGALPRGVGDPGAAPPGGGVVRFVNGGAHRALGDGADLAVLRDPRQRLLGRGRLASVAT